MRKIVVHVNLTDATTPLHTPPYPAKTGKMFDRLLRLKTKTTSSRQRGEEQRVLAAGNLHDGTRVS